jgi:hypothetical protein
MKRGDGVSAGMKRGDNDDDGAGAGKAIVGVAGGLLSGLCTVVKGIGRLAMEGTKLVHAAHLAAAKEAQSEIYDFDGLGRHIGDDLLSGSDIEEAPPTQHTSSSEEEKPTLLKRTDDLIEKTGKAVKDAERITGAAEEHLNRPLSQVEQAIGSLLLMRYRAKKLRQALLGQIRARAKADRDRKIAAVAAAASETACAAAAAAHASTVALLELPRTVTPPRPPRLLAAARRYVYKKRQLTELQELMTDKQVRGDLTDKQLNEIRERRRKLQDQITEIERRDPQITEIERRDPQIVYVGSQGSSNIRSLRDLS